MPKAPRTPDDFVAATCAQMPAAMKKVEELLKRSGHPPATHNQLLVWSACYLIPSGSVASYGTVSKIMHAVDGDTSPHPTRYSRLAGRLLAQNPIAPVVPCHRVVGSSGKLVGFEGSAEGKTTCKKLELLRSEGISMKPSGTSLDTVVL